MMKIIFILTIYSLALSDRGDLISFSFKEERDANYIQNELEDYVNDLGAGSIVTPNSVYNVKLYSIVYETIDQFGEYTQASGSVAFPIDQNFAYPMYLFGHGTQVRRLSAPSMNGFNLLNQWLPSEGFIYMEPDYLGLGVSQILHPYHLKDVTASSMIDMIYAVRNLCAELNFVQYNNQLFIAGYSEGGYATMATVKEIEENYNDINITMSFPMAGAYDLSGTMVQLMLSEEEYPDPFYLPFFILSYIEKYKLGVLDDFFKPEYSSILPELFSGEYSGGYINDYLPDVPINMMLDGMVEEFTNDLDFPFRIYLAENDLVNWSPNSPMYLLHGEADERVPVENSIIAYNSFIQNGSSSVSLEVLPSNYGGHQDAAPFCLIFADTYSKQAKLVLIKGNINQDVNNEINILDITSMVDVILYGIIDGLQLWLSDLDNNYIVNVVDIIGLIEVVLYNE